MGQLSVYFFSNCLFLQQNKDLTRFGWGDEHVDNSLWPEARATNVDAIFVERAAMPPCFINQGEDGRPIRENVGNLGPPKH